ncbi:hypothetical protein ACJ72_02071 [Emergomyces africanus]|uniref:HNH nuclease domain-containing protein n=1 Tax=Emergomyces africanus TaxID=1955775 RepID=A0A1B7P3G9_9EURO|nr:hypothetical protein ACJ72_02071 [Emergomyces africanus]
MFDHSITHHIDDTKINDLSNIFTLMLDNHQLIDKFHIYFEPTNRVYEYRIYSVENSVLNNSFFTVTQTLTLSSNHTIDSQSPQFLDIHHAIPLILKLSDTAEYIEQTLRDLKQVTVKADESTHLEDMMRLQFDSWTNQLSAL